MSDTDRLLINEIFTSIQGESTFTGLPCTFVRTGGCNLHCRWCDTPQARRGGAAMSRRQVTERALDGGSSLVAVTGGEPLTQPAVLPLMVALCDAGRTVLLETNGSRDISGVDPRVHRIMDLKAPGSGQGDHNRLENLEHLTDRDELKFVLADRGDYEWMVRIIADHRLDQRGLALLVACVIGELEPRQLASWVLADRLDVRLQVQLHKVIWGAEATGV
jgi:7-carboxy-7-deazaguanine synthase